MELRGLRLCDVYLCQVSVFDPSVRSIRKFDASVSTLFYLKGFVNLPKLLLSLFPIQPQTLTTQCTHLVTFQLNRFLDSDFTSSRNWLINYWNLEKWVSNWHPSLIGILLLWVKHEDQCPFHLCLLWFTRDCCGITPPTTLKYNNTHRHSDYNV